MQKNGFVCLICCREPHHTHPIPTDNKHCVSKYNNNNNNIEWKGNGAQYRLFIQLLFLYKTHKYIYNVHICSQTPLHSASAGSQKSLDVHVLYVYIEYEVRSETTPIQWNTIFHSDDASNFTWLLYFVVAYISQTYTRIKQ